LIHQAFKEKTSSIKKFLDFDKSEEICYDNIYLAEHKIVIKIPLFILNKMKFNVEIKIEGFNLDNYVFLLSYD
jgi:hypothetical protein